MNDILSNTQKLFDRIPQQTDQHKLMENCGISVMENNPGEITVRRETLESIITATIDEKKETATIVQTPMVYFNQMVETIFNKAGFSVHASYHPRKANIDLTHVVTEDMGIVLGTALKSLLEKRQNDGVNQRGSSVSGTAINVSQENCVFIGISVEGRKEFQLITPHQDDEVHTIIHWDVEDTTSSTLFSLLLGLAEGLMAEITINPLSGSDPHHIWEAVFRGVGSVIRNFKKSPAHPQTQLTNKPNKNLPPSPFQIVDHTVNIVTSLERPELMVSVENTPRRQYNIDTGCHFINHAIEHIAWNSGLNIDVHAHNLPPEEIGKTLGIAISQSDLGSSSIDIGVIDEASVMVTIDRNKKPGLKIAAFESKIKREEILAGVENDTRRVDLDDFYQAIAQSMGAAINIYVVRKPEDGHTWHHISEAFSVALKQVFKPNTYLAGTTSGVKGVNI